VNRRIRFAAVLIAMLCRTSIAQDGAGAKSTETPAKETRISVTVETMLSVWSGPTLLSERLGVVDPGNTVVVTGFKAVERFYQVQFKGVTGYIEERGLKRNEALDRLVEEAVRVRETERPKAGPVKPGTVNEAAKLKVLTILYGEKIAIRIMQKKVWRGMTKEMVLQSIGEPKSVKRTAFSNVIKEQWEYSDGTLLFFDNDTLMAYGGPPREFTLPN
jgi:hypothetical protein